jgi:hypothetical protein
VGNFGDGTISAFDTTGKFLGQFTDSSNKVLVNPGLWDLVFGGGGGASNDPGATGTLYLTAGGSAGQPNFPAGGSSTAVFASLVPATATGANFTLSLSAQKATVAMGSSADLMVSASAVGGFTGDITLSCTAPAGLSCAFNPTTISPGSSATSSTLTVSAAATPPPVTGYSLSGMAMLLPGLGLFGTVFTTGKRKPFARKSILWTSVLGLLLIVSMFALGCGGGNSAAQTPSNSQVTMMVTGTSGTISHTTPVTITIN